jgi:MFS family permease
MAQMPSAAPPPAPSGVLGVLSNRRFLTLWLAQLATQVGGNMVIFGLAILVFGKTGSNSAVSLLILTFLVPAVVFSAVAGVYVDRFDRRLILIGTNLVRGIAFLAMALVSDQLAVVYALNVVISTVTTFFAPAELAMIPVLVERERLLQATGLFNLTMNASFALGFALLGPLIVNLLGPEVLLLAVAASYFAAAGLCVTLPPAPSGEGGLTPAAAIGGVGRAVSTLGRQLREGLAYIGAHQRIFWSLGYLGITASLIGILGVLGPGFATTGLGLREADFVVVVLPLGAGVVTGVLVLNAYGRYLPRRRVIEGGLLGLAAMLGVLSVSGPISRFLQSHTSTGGGVNIGNLVSLLSIVVVLAFLAGVAYALVAIPAQAQLQEELEEDVRGRVFGVLNMLVSMASFLPIILVGPIADMIGTSLVLLAAAAMVGVAGAGSILIVHPAGPASAVPAAHVGPIDPVTRVEEYDAALRGAVGSPAPRDAAEPLRPPATRPVSVGGGTVEEDGR